MSRGGSQSSEKDERNAAEQEVSGKKPILWTSLLLFSICLARIASGLFISIHGPTLLTLANNVGATVGEVSWLFSGRSAGVLVGGIMTGVVMRRFNNMVSFGIASLVLGGVVTATPWITDLWLLVVVVLLGGIVFGYLDASMQALILQIWGEKESRGFISGYHFAIALGAFLAPIIAQPFLVQDVEDVCPASNEQPLNVSTTEMMPTGSVPQTEPGQPGVNPVVWAYLICGVYMFVVAAVFFLLAWVRTEEKVRSSKQEAEEKRSEDSVKRIALLFALVCVYYFFCVAGETAYNSYIYSVSICSGLHFSIADGTTINALFWIGFGAGRLGGVVFLRYLTPRTVLIVDFIGIIVSMIIVCVFGEQTAEVTWAITFFYSFFQATVYPAGVSWTSQYTNMSGNYIFIFSAGQALGTMVLLPVGGIIFDADPFSVMYLILGCSVLNAVTYGLMVLEGRRIGSNTDDLAEEQEEPNFTKF